jgi:hypothetical protein
MGETKRLSSLGKGEVVLALAKDHVCIWLLFKFGSSSDEELRWFCMCICTKRFVHYV